MFLSAIALLLGFAGLGDIQMVTRVATVAFQGIEAVPVDVQVQIAPGVPAFIMSMT